MNYQDQNKNLSKKYYIKKHSQSNIYFPRGDDNVEFGFDENIEFQVVDWHREDLFPIVLLCIILQSD